MINKTNTCLGIALATLTMAGALVAPEAVAHSKAERMAEAANNKADALEAQLRAMQDELATLRAQASQMQQQAPDNSAKVQELDQWMNSVKSEPTKANRKNNLVFFRGGYARNDHSREGSILTDANATNSGGAATNIGSNLGVNLGSTTNWTGNSQNGDEDAWYFGAGFDLNLSDDLLGLMQNTNLLGEITFDYKQFDAKDLRRAPLGTAANDSVNGAAGVGTPANAVCAGNPALNATGTGGLIVNGAGPYGSCSANVTVTQISITASPKVKFMADSKFRPWVIPAGFSLNVISPPTNGVTYIAPGIMFAAGADYNVWNNIFVGVDARYRLMANTTDNVNLDGMEAGGYIGFGF